MRRAVAVSLSLLACLAFAGSARAQDEEPVYAPASEAHRPDRWSMQFQVAQDFQLSGFNGAGLAMTRNSSASGAWRLGVGFGASFIHGHTENSELPEAERYGVTFDLLRMKRFNPDRRIGLELGVGPSIGFNHEEFTQQVDLGDTGFAIQENHYSSQVYGVVARFGVEVLLARSLSVHAHYGALAAYRHIDQLTESQEFYDDGTSRNVSMETTGNSWTLSNLGVTLGVSAYL
jgi:opacity protein-like surface antigen